MVDQVAAVNILQQSLDVIKADQQLAGYRVNLSWPSELSEDQIPQRTENGDHS